MSEHFPQGKIKMWYLLEFKLVVPVKLFLAARGRTSTDVSLTQLRVVTYISWVILKNKKIYTFHNLMYYTL